MHSGFDLQGSDDGKEILSCRVAVRSEHAHEALRRFADDLAQPFETDRGVDRRAHRRASAGGGAIEKILHRLAQ